MTNYPTKYESYKTNDLNPCDSNPCWNGGTCIKTGIDSYNCSCPVGESKILEKIKAQKTDDIQKITCIIFT
jgi:hypothetical protein